MKSIKYARCIVCMCNAIIDELSWHFFWALGKQLNHQTPQDLKGSFNVCKLIQMDLSSESEFKGDFKFLEPALGPQFTRCCLQEEN